jgi:hypothetical protein
MDPVVFDKSVVFEEATSGLEHYFCAQSLSGLNQRPLESGIWNLRLLQREKEE